MQNAKILEQRFETLIQKAEAILGRKSCTEGNIAEGTAIFVVDSAEAAGWCTSAMNLLELSYGNEKAIYQRFEKQSLRIYNSASEFSKAKAILEAANEDFKLGLVGSLRSLVNADACNDLLEQATELVKRGYIGPAGVVAGIALELRLKNLCEARQIPLGKVDKMNADLRKEDVLTLTLSKKITYWADIRNKCAHGEWSAIDAKDVEEMIDGVERFIGEVS